MCSKFISRLSIVDCMFISRSTRRDNACCGASCGFFFFFFFSAVFLAYVVVVVSCFESRMKFEPLAQWKLIGGKIYRMISFSRTNRLILGLYCIKPLLFLCSISFPSSPVGRFFRQLWSKISRSAMTQVMDAKISLQTVDMFIWHM